MKKIIEQIFSVKNSNTRKHKIITVLGIKIKFKRKPKYIEQRFAALERQLNNISWKQNLIMDYFIDPSSARPATGALALRQNENYMLLKEFARVCHKNNINYWIDYGTLLGSKRHNGFVPWDDDIDVAMLKEDFDKLKDIANQELNAGYIYHHPLEKYSEEFARIIFKNDSGAFLDIYAYENTQEGAVYMLPPSTKNDKTPIPHQVLQPFSETKFLDTTVKTPNNIEAYLRIKYGNWEIMPKARHAVGGHKPLNERYVEYINPLENVNE